MSKKSNESRGLDPERMKEAARCLTDDPLARYVLSYTFSLKKEIRKKWPYLTDADIDDIISETILQFYEERDKYDPAKASIKTWLTTKARYQALTLYRQRERLPTQTLTGLEETLAALSELVSDSDGNADSTSLALEEWLQKLPQRQKEVIQLSGQGVSDSEIAQQLGITRKTVRVHRHQGIKHLRQLRQNLEGNT